MVTRIDPVDLDPNVAIGLDLPLTEGTITFFNLNYTSLDQAKTNLKNLILTEKGERIMLPDYGCGLRLFLFETNISSMTEKIKDTINETVERWLPYIIIKSIEFSTDETENHLFIKMTFSLDKDIDMTEELVLNITK